MVRQLIATETAQVPDCPPPCEAGTQALPSNGFDTFYLDAVRGRNQSVVAVCLRAGLSVLSIPYGAVVAGRNWLYDRGWKAAQRLPVPVVSVGNLTLGGTGKTPAVEHIARLYQGRGRRPVIISRGYGTRNGPNDEALVIAANLSNVPHLQGANRAALAQAAVAEHQADVIILDDGFQHRRLARDLDMVLIDATEPWGYKRLFPRGLLRESRRSLRRASLVLLTRCDQVSHQALHEVRAEIEKWAPKTAIAHSIHAPVRLLNPRRAERKEDIAVLLGKPVAAFCGIGNPAAFRRSVEKLGCDVTAFRVYSDHYRYTEGDKEELERWVTGLHLPADGMILTTQKDLVKLPLAQLGGRPLWALQIALRITHGQEVLDRKLKGVLP